MLHCRNVSTCRYIEYLELKNNNNFKLTVVITVHTRTSDKTPYGNRHFNPFQHLVCICIPYLEIPTIPLPGQKRAIYRLASPSPNRNIRKI